MNHHHQERENQLGELIKMTSEEVGPWCGVAVQNVPKFIQRVS